MGHLISPRLLLTHRATEALERLDEKRLNVVRLQSTRVCALHLLAHPRHPTGIHDVMGERTIFYQRLKVRPIDSVLNSGRQARTHLRQIAITNGFDEQIAQRSPLELELAEYVEYLPAQRLTSLFELLQETTIDVALARLACDEIPESAHLSLPDTVDTTEALFQAIRIPREIVVHHQVRALKIDTLTGGVCGEQHLDVRIMQEARLRLSALFTTHAAVNQHDR